MISNITIRRGSTFSDVLYYAQPVLTVKPITGLTRSGQAVVTAAAHGVPLDWWVWVVGVGGMSQANHRSDELKNLNEAYRAYYVDAATLRLDLDTSRFAPYTSGGELLYFPPIDISGYTARMQIRDPDADGTVAVSLTNAAGLTLTTHGEIKRVIAASVTELLDFDLGVYDLELVDPLGVVIPIVSGEVIVEDEVTK